MFIRKRKTNKGYSYQLIQSYRLCGKVKQRIVVNLSCFPRIEEALAYTTKRMQWFEEKPSRIELMKEKAASCLHLQYVFWVAWNQKLKDVVSQKSRQREVHDTTKRW